ncbi:hypothetical protein P3452_13840 [Vibrio parahaemolyticus]|nr:hypothetical protein [Vibrio parahaemolyticus]
MRSHYKRIGDYVTQIKLKNTDGSISSLKGININKHFMPSVANINGTDLSKYRVVKKNQFAFNPMHVGRDEVLPISMLEDDEPIIVSPAYVVFEVKDEEELLPAYLMMWCRRSEFDRNAWFMTDNSVRGGFCWDDFCDMELPVPSIDKQREIVREYNVVNDRIALNEQLTQKLEDTAQTIYKQWFVDFEFPISKEYAESIGKPELEGKPYKSSGGEMFFCESKTEESIPIDWSNGTLESLYKFQYGKGNNNPSNGGVFPVYGSNGVIGGYDSFNAEDSPVIGHIGANCGSLVFAFGKHYVTYNGVICNALDDMGKYFSYVTLCIKDLQSQTRGSSQPFVSYDMLYGIQAVIPSKDVKDKYESLASVLFEKIRAAQKEISILEQMKTIVLQRISKA